MTANIKGGAYGHPRHLAKVARNERANREGYRPHDTDNEPTEAEIAAVEAEQAAADTNAEQHERETY